MVFPLGSRRADVWGEEEGREADEWAEEAAWWARVVRMRVLGRQCTLVAVKRGGEKWHGAWRACWGLAICFPGRVLRVCEDERWFFFLQRWHFEDVRTDRMLRLL
jgi:hypothetical protein